jgi:hypothetical protein
MVRAMALQLNPRVLRARNTQASPRGVKQDMSSPRRLKRTCTATDLRRDVLQRARQAGQVGETARPNQFADGRVEFEQGRQLADSTDQQ